MGNILDYLDWRGDLTFEQSPFNEVDNLILSCFSYLDLDEITELKNGDTLCIKDLSERFSTEKKEQDMKAESAFLQNTPIVALDPESLRKYFIRKTNQNTKATGKPELLV